MKKIFLAEIRGRWLLWLKIYCALIFWFCNSNVTTFETRENVKISIIAFKLSREKCHIFKSILRIFKNILLAERWAIWLLWLKISCAQRYWFCNSNVKTFPKSRKCKNFNFSLYTVAAQMVYLQKYLTNLRKPFFGWKKRKMAIVVENLWCTDIGFAIATLQLPNSRKCKYFNFSLYTVPAEMLFLQ